jgi:flagellar motor switch protein FliM
MSETHPRPDVTPVVTVKGGAAPPEVKRYDFLRPPLGGERDPSAVEALFGRVADLLATQLTSRLRSPAQVARVEVVPTYVHDFIATLQEPCIAFRFDAGGGGGGQGLIEIDGRFGALLVDRLFGGDGEVEPPARPLSALERMAMQGLAERWIALLAEARPGLGEAGALRFEADKKTLLKEMAEGRALAIAIAFALGAAEGAVRLCIPAPAVAGLEPGAKPRPGERRAAAARAQRADDSPLAGELRRARVIVQARLPLLHLRAGAVAGLREGQVIHTGLPIDAEAEVMVNGRLRYRASLGAVHGRIGVKISDVVPEPAAVAPATPRAGRIL